MKLKLVNKIEEAKDTYSFFFEASEKIDWKPGQYIYITLPKLNYPDERGETRHFTISASPTETDLIRITTRIREESGYKKTLNELPLDTEFEGKGPQGMFVLTEEDKNQNIFLAGGIGITPFRSFMKYNLDKNLGIPINLIYSNSDSDFVFKNEIDLWSEENEQLRIKYIDTSAEGRIDKDKLHNQISEWQLDINTTKLWVVGPPPFVNALEEILESLDINEDNIETEKFTGY